MKNKKQYILSIILFLALLIGTYYFILRDYSIDMFIDSIKNCNIIYIMMAFGCVFLYSFFASLYTKRMFYHFNKKINWYQAFGYLFTEVYFSAITPSSIDTEGRIVNAADEVMAPFKIFLSIPIFKPAL